LLLAALLTGTFGAAEQATAQPFRTNEPFPMLQFDHGFVHSGTHLQGVRAREKWAGGLIFQPPAVTGFQGMSSVVIVDNPDPFLTMTATVVFFDSAGIIPSGGITTLVIPPQGHAFAPATALASSLGFGTARVTVSENSPPLVGATLHNAVSIIGIADRDRPLSTHGRAPGASSMQQLQEVQEQSTRLWFGPMPLSLNTGAPDFDDGNLPFFHVVNPNPQSNAIQVNVTIFDRVTGVVIGPLPWRNILLPPFGTLSEISGPHLVGGNPGLWNAARSLLTTGVDFDLMVEVISEDGLPILGDGYMVDLLGRAGTGSRFRMASAMMASTPNGDLLSPEFSIDLPGGIIQTLIGIVNVGANDAGPITVTYFDNLGSRISSSSIASLPFGQTVRVDPSLPGYPTGTRGFGSAQITSTATDPQLVGVTVREILSNSTAEIPQHHKAYGETLLQLNGSEPGPGWVDAASGFIRKVSPLVHVDLTSPTLPWPGYTTFGNFSAGNIGPYDWSFWTATGTRCNEMSAFPNVPFLATSWTYEDALIAPLLCPGPNNLSGRVDHEHERIEGINVLGDPFDEYGIPGFPID
jgi:hypothetical protein